MFLTHSCDSEALVGLCAQEVRGHVREQSIHVADGEVHLRVGSLLARLGHVVLLEDLVQTLAQRGDG